MNSRALKSNEPLVEALAQLDLDGQSKGAISKLPNEMLRAILGRVQAHHLIRLRLVNKKLKVVVEDILRDKKGLVIMEHSANNTNTLLKMSKRFNGHVKWNRDFVFIRQPLNRFHLSGKLCTLLAKLFPNIEQFFMDGYLSYCSPEIASILPQWSSTLNTLSLRPVLFFEGHFNDLCAPINDLVKLKKFDISAFYPTMIAQLGPTLARLEHLSGCTIEGVIMSLPNLEAGITSLGIDSGFRCVTIGNLTKLNRLYGSFVSSLERFSLYSSNPDVVPFICQHFSSLKVLRFDCDWKLTNNMIEHLARLTHLTELRIVIFIDMAALDIANLVPLDNIRTFSLVNFEFVTGRQYHHDTLPPNFDVHQFSRILSTIFPNVEKLIVKSRYLPMFENLLEPHVNLFVNLRSHDFGLTDPTDRLMD